MITSIELENVRIFEGAGWKFSLLPMTVLCGTNSAGKSTILKTLLLLQQSQEIPDSYGISQGKLRLVGNQVDLGSYSSFVSNNDIRKNISFSIAIKDEMPISYYKKLLDLNPRVAAKTGNNSSCSSNEVFKEDNPIDYTLKVTFTFGIVRGKSKRITATSTLKAIESNEGAASFTPQAVLRKSKYEISVDNEKLLCWNIERNKHNKEESYYEIIIPAKFFNSLKATKNLLPKLETRRNVRFLVAHPGIIPISILAQERPKSTESFDSRVDLKEDDQWLYARLPPIIRESISDLYRALTSVHYVGPLRSSPQRYYLLYSEPVSKIDPTGASLPYLFREKAIYSSSVWNISPCEDHEPTQEPLSKALNSWLYYLRVGEKPPQDVRDAEIEVCVTSDLVVELKIKSATNQKLYSLADSGFGYSQVLPIVVKGLLAEPESVLLIEQPELHLNPALQVRLADFLMAMVRAKKHIILETHSEHIINAIRVLTAEDESGELESQCGIYFIDAQSDSPFIHELSIRADGSIPDLPHHFFGEAISLGGRLLRAQKRFRKSSMRI